MNPGGDAAEQVVRLSLEGMEVAAKISGEGAKKLAVLLYTVLKQEQKTKGKTRLTSMLRSGKELKIYTITQNDLRKFSQEAKRYGVLYCVLKDRNNPDPEAAIDVIARADDASKIQRITERFKLATVSHATVAGHTEREKDEFFLKEQPSNPREARTACGPLSEPGSKQAGRYGGLTSERDRPSVRMKLNAYRTEKDRTKERSSIAKEAIDTVKEIGRAVSKTPGKEER